MRETYNKKYRLKKVYTQPSIHAIGLMTEITKSNSNTNANDNPTSNPPTKGS
jgi:hypothetical protein